MPVLNPLSPHRLDFSLDQGDAADRHRRALSLIFLHDILNTAGGIKGVAELLVEAKAKDDSELRELALAMATQMVEEISAQQDLMAAEAGTVEALRIEISTGPLIGNLADRFRKLPVAAGRFIQVAPGSENLRLSTDPRLLERVLSNMLINALEAEPAGSTILIGCERKPGAVHFWVRNPGYIPPSIQPRIFDGSFSTKGSNRGLGTYSMLLLTERFLGGSIGFATDPDRGTVFRLTLPCCGP